MNDVPPNEARERKSHVSETNWFDSHHSSLCNSVDLGWLWQGLDAADVVQKEIRQSEARVTW